MESALFELAVTALATWGVWRFISRRLAKPGNPSSEPGDYAGRPAPLRTPPRGRSGAVALAEPEEDGDIPYHSPRRASGL